MNCLPACCEIRAEILNLGQKLYILRDRLGWKALGYASWAECVEREFGYSRQHANRLIKAQEVRAQVEPIGSAETPGSGELLESHARELVRLPDDQRADCYRDYVEECEQAGTKPTAAGLREEVDSWLADNEPYVDEADDGADDQRHDDDAGDQHRGHDGDDQQEGYDQLGDEDQHADEQHGGHGAGDQRRDDDEQQVPLIAQHWHTMRNRLRNWAAEYGPSVPLAYLEDLIEEFWDQYPEESASSIEGLEREVRARKRELKRAERVEDGAE